MPGKRIMIFTIPNEGHLNILKRMIREYRDRHTFAVTLVDRHNSPPELGDLPAPVRALRGSSRYLNTPAVRVLQRVHDLLDECLQATCDFRPDLILYDFCALEGRFTADALRLRSWCSVPGLIGPLVDTEYLARCVSSVENRDAIRSIRYRYGVAVEPSEFELVSNSLYLPAELNLLWSYPAVTPADFRRNRRPARYQFAGYLSDGHSRRPRHPNRRPLVYLSFGTEVMDNLWLAQEETRQGVRSCVAALAKLWERDELHVIFSTQGRRVLDTYPTNWTVRDRVDQQQVLSAADVFVTHGGSNSLHEALLVRVPLVVTPFFGDQALAARRVEELGVGIGLGVDDRVDKDKPKHFLTPELAGRIDDAVKLVLRTDRYRRALERLPLSATPPLAELD
jgi:UDP-glucoronosyl and UDP-glucosyl transferase